MPRQPRHIRPGEVYHLISRFVDRDWFIKKEQERRDYLALLGDALIASDWRCHSYALMSNHIHLGVVAGADPLDSWIRRVHAPFAGAMNRAYDRIGPMFVRGPKALVVAAGAVGNVIAYIHNNPVRAKVVEDASGSSWTSHRAYVGLAQVPPWLDVRGGLALAGFSDSMAFHQWVADPAREHFDHLHDEEVMQDTCDAVDADERSSAVDPHSIVMLTATELGISVAQLRSRRRGSVELVGRQAVVVCAQRAGLKGTDVARALGVSQQAVSRIGSRGIGTNVIALSARVQQKLESQR